MESMDFVSPATVSLADTALLNPSLADALTTPEPAPKQEKKPVKKRKSWGQELPVPKTNLPPRKRAKTDDEKEQRRIERVLRNRQAAQSSRERKRLEVERLECERDAIREHNNILKQRLLTVEDEKEALRKQVAKLQMLLGSENTPAPTPSPMMSAKIFDEKVPSIFDDEAETEALDLTQHPAEVLCDLQCQPKAPAATQSLPPQAQATALLFLITHSIACSTIASPLLRLLASLKKGSRLKTTTISPTLFTLMVWLISTPTSPLRPPLTTARTTTSAPTNSSPPSPRPSTFRTSLLRRFLNCNPALARPLKDATARALREKAKYALRESSTVGVMERGIRGTRGVQSASPKADVWRLMTMALLIDQFEKRDKESRQSGIRRR